MLMAVIKTAYPEFNRDLRGEEHEAAVSLWQNRLEPYTYAQCDAALKGHIDECKFAPKIAEIIERISSLPGGTHSPGRWPLSDLEVSSMINVRLNLGLDIPPAYFALIKSRGLPGLMKGAHDE